MPQTQSTIYTSQANPTTPPIDPTPLLQYGNNPTAIILSIAILLWVLRPVMLQQKSDTSEKPASPENESTHLGKNAIASLLRTLNSR